MTYKNNNFILNAIKKIVVLFSFALIVLIHINCGQSTEYKKVKEALEKHPQIVKNGYIIGKIRFLPKQSPKESDVKFEAELRDKNGNTIGKVLGVRIEGFATDIIRIELTNDKKTAKSQTDSQTSDPVGGLLRHLKKGKSME